MTTVTIAVVTGILSAFAGAVINSRFNLSLARRAEFNKVADSIAVVVQSHLKGPSAYKKFIGSEDIVLIRRHMGRRLRKRFDAAIQQYEKATDKSNQSQDGLGQVSYKDHSLIVQALRKIEACVHRW